VNRCGAGVVDAKVLEQDQKYGQHIELATCNACQRHRMNVQCSRSGLW
jgi:hypothetical protein